MMIEMTKTQNKYQVKITIFSKLLIGFTLLILIPILFISYISFVSARDNLTKAQMSKLDAIADLKVDKIVSYFKRIDADMVVVQSFWNIKKNLPIVSAYLHDQTNPQYMTAKQALDNQFKIFQKVNNQYNNIVLLNIQGELVYEFSHLRDHEADWVKERENILIKSKDGIYRSPVFQYSGTIKKYGMMIAAPAYDEYGKPIAIIVIEIDMTPIYESIQDATGLGATGETLIVEKREKEILYLNPLRHDEVASLKKAIELDDTDGVVSWYTVIGQNGDGVITDYRAKQTLAAWRYIPFLNWSLVVKIDTDETLATVYVFERFLWFLIAIILSCGILAAFTVAKSIADPIHKLHKGTEIIGSGNLDYRVGTETPDEIGQLSRSFDEMVVNLKKITTSRDDLNQALREREEFEKKLIVANKVIESANKAKSEFLSVMSHELRTPLNAVIGFSEVLIDGNYGALNEKQKEYIIDILTSGRHLLSLINDVLDISKVEAGKMEFKLEEVNVKFVVDSSLLMIKEKAKAHNIELIENISENIGNVMADEKRMKQIMYNLLSNAIKFTPDGGKIGVEVEKNNNNEILFVVWDTGIGIEEKDKSKIFAEFKQIDSELSRKHIGTGLGLSLTKKLIELHGGKIWFESAGKDKGTKFSFTLPIAGKVS